ncbi:MAG: hypothetical protein CL666_11910 [Balneola sp.]|nr:hypothetical protein [Balneola sp.]|tara:strand:+ start:4707 stop:5882 length:1176 start_codon:yes stop_codon:yes gene_type:complete
MASLRKRSGTYYIRFFTTINGKRKRKAFSLGTKIKREAEKMLIDYEDKFQRGVIDPFNGWSPKMEADKKRESLSGKHMSLQKASNLFLEERNHVTQKTLDNYERHLDMLMEQVGQTMPVTQITEQDIRDFCFKPDLAAATQASYLTHLNVFFKWLHEKKILPKNLTKNLKKPKVPKKISQKIVTREQLDMIFEAFDEYYEELDKIKAVTKPEQRRLWFKPMINTIFYCGLRAKEAVNLKWADVTFKKPTKKSKEYGVIRITNSDKNTTKSKLERVIPIRKGLYESLKQWYKDQGEPTDGYVFPSASGIDQWSKMDTLALSKSYKKFVKEADDVPNTPNLHGLRHSCATDLLAQGVSPVIVKKILGHASLDTTMIYEHLNVKNITNALKGID